MAKSPFAWKNKSTLKLSTFSDSEFEAAKQLVQLGSGDSDIHNDEDGTNNNYSVPQRKYEEEKQSKVDSPDVTSSAAIDDILAEAEDEISARRNQRYRSIGDLYRVSQRFPAVPVIRAKKKIKWC